jgi:hypothetical protein
MSMTSTEVWFNQLYTTELWTTELRQEYDRLTGPQPWRTDDESKDFREKYRREIIGASFWGEDWSMQLNSIMEELRRQDEEKKMAYEALQGQSQAQAIKQTEASLGESSEKVNGR